MPRWERFGQTFLYDDQVNMYHVTKTGAMCCDCTFACILANPDRITHPSFFCYFVVSSNYSFCFIYNRAQVCTFMPQGIREGETLLIYIYSKGAVIILKQWMINLCHYSYHTGTFSVNICVSVWTFHRQMVRPYQTGRVPLLLSQQT